MTIWKIIILICTAFLLSETKLHRLNHHEKRETNSGICDPTFNSTSKVQCYCAKDTKEIVRSAECYLTYDNISPDDADWSKFIILQNATKIDLTNTRGITLKYIPQTALKQAKNLQTLNVKYGNIETVESYACANISSVVEITLSGNQIKILQTHSFAHHASLTQISLDTNNIFEINRDVFFDVPSLEKLFLTNNKITTIHDKAFIHLTNLKELEIDRNRLFSLNSETFTGLNKLLKLDLSSNSLEVIGDNTFKPLSVLVSLNLDGNKIQMLDSKAFHGLSKLQSLSLAHNELTELDNFNIFKGLDSLTSFSLKGNRIRELKKSVIAPILNNLYCNSSVLDVEDNNFPCSCQLEWFMSLMNRTESSALRLVLENFKCLPDAELREKWIKIEETSKNNNATSEEEEIQAQSQDYEYYDETQLNGKLFYIDVRDLLNCSTTLNSGGKSIQTTTAKSISTAFKTWKESTKVNTSPILTTTSINIFANKEDILDISLREALKTTKAPEIIKQKIANQEQKGNIPNIYTTSRLNTVSAKPMQNNNYNEVDMASDEAKPDNIKAYRSVTEKNDFDVYTNNAIRKNSFSLTIVVYLIVLTIKLTLY